MLGGLVSSAAWTLGRSRPRPQQRVRGERPSPAGARGQRWAPARGGPERGQRAVSSEVSVLPQGVPAVSLAGAGVAAVSPGLASPPCPRKRDARQTPRWKAAGSAPLVMWFFIVGGLTVPRPLPAARELGIRGLAGQRGGAAAGRGRCEGAVGVMGLLARPPAQVCTRSWRMQPGSGGRPPALLGGEPVGVPASVHPALLCASVSSSVKQAGHGCGGSLHR